MERASNGTASDPLREAITDCVGSSWYGEGERSDSSKAQALPSRGIDRERSRSGDWKGRSQVHDRVRPRKLTTRRTAALTYRRPRLLAAGAGMASIRG
ncbi:hypothetical protein [Streptomyces pratensis]|uniref:hypothetical protein n=1 Tax=Streptomyces pratensis TaxID=1169025 RepID=UPI003015E3BD